MFTNLGWTEMLVIAVVAVIFVAPKDLLGMLRQFGRFSRKVRDVAGDFQKQVDDALRESELDSVRDSINDVRSLDPRKAIKDQLNPLKAELERDPNAHSDDVPLESEAPPVFDENAGPTPATPVKVDVEAALARQAELDAQAAKPVPPRAVAPTKAAAAKKRAARKPAAKKTAAKAPADKAAGTKATAVKKQAAKRAAPKKADA